MTWPTEQAREAVEHMSCVWIDCPGPHDPRHGPDGPQIAREEADRILAALAEHVAAREAQAWDDDGFDAGHQAARAVNPEWPALPTNPHRTEETP